MPSKRASLNNISFSNKTEQQLKSKPSSAMASSLGDVYLKNNKKNKAIIPIKNPFFPYSISDIGDHASPTFAHLDNDEYPDAVVNLNTFTNIQAVFNSSIDDVLKQRKQGKKSLQDSALLNILNERHYGTFGMFYYAPYGGDSPGPTIHQTLIDFDGDGNLDLFYGSINGGIYHVKGKKPKGQLAVSLYPRWPIFTSNRNKPEYILISGAKHSKPAPIDIDNDGDTDLIVGTQDGTLYLLTNDNKNTKTTLGQFSQPRAISGKNGTITFGGKYATPTAADVNDDGLQDLFVGSESGDIYFYKALGYKSKTSKKPSLFFDKPIKNPFGIQKVGRHSVPALADTDQDGDLELYIGTEDGNTHVFDFPSKEKPTISFKTQPGSYKVGQTIQIAVKFSDRVDVDTRIFIPTLKLNSGINAEAVYTSGSGSDTLIFNYKVAKGDQTNQLNHASTDALQLNGSSIKFASKNLNANLELHEPRSKQILSNLKKVKVDGGTIPTIQSLKSLTPKGKYGEYSVIQLELNFSEIINVDNKVGSPVIALHAGETKRFAKYASGSGSKKLIFEYIVMPNDNTKKLQLSQIDEKSLIMHGSTITDTQGNPADTRFEHLSKKNYNLGQIEIETIKPTGALGKFSNKPQFVHSPQAKLAAILYSEKKTSDLYNYRKKQNLPHLFTTLTAGDINGDGNADLLKFDELNSRFELYWNSSPTDSGELSYEKDEEFSLDIGDIYSRMPTQAQILTAGTLVDIDSDGDLDLALNSSHKEGGLFVYENNSNDRTSTPSFKLVSASFYLGNTIPETTKPIVLGELRWYNGRGLQSNIYHNLHAEFADMDQDGDLDIFIPGHIGNIDFLENRALLGANLPKYLDHAVRPFGLPSHEKSKYAPLVRLIDINNDGELELIYRYRADSIEYGLFINQPFKGSSELNFTSVTGGDERYKTRDEFYHTPGEKKQLEYDNKNINRTVPTSGKMVYPCTSWGSQGKFFDDYDNDGDIDYIAECPFGKKYYMHFIENIAETPIIPLRFISPAGSYKVGSKVRIHASFSEPVIVDADQGRPSITLNNGAKAFYTSGSGSKKLVFSYTIEPGQSVESLGQKSNKALQLNGGKITDQAGNNALIALAHGGQRGSLSTSAKINIVNGTKLDDSKQPSLDDTSASIKEDATPGTSILDLADSNSGKDLDAAGNSLTYAIKSGNSSGLFSINPATGLISLAPGKSLDFESKSSYKLNVSASNSSNKTNSATVTINVTDVADHSPSIADQSVSIKEDAEPGTTILDLDDSSGGDTDADGEALTYSITSGNADNLFSINANTGLISLASGQSLDYESKTQHILTVTASDGTNSDSTDITINVSDVADQSPSIADRTLSVLSSLSPGTSILDLDDASGNDTDADGQNLTYSITSGNSAGTFSLNSSTGVLSLATGQALTGTTYPLTITASDGTNSDSADITINVAQTADQSPSISNKLIYVEESVTAGTTLVDFADASGGDTDADGQALTYSITSGNSAGTFSINPASGILTIASGQSLDYESTTAYTLEVAASDGVNSDVATVNINVVDVADAAPSVDNYAVYAEESITPGTTLIDLADSSGGDTDADGEALTYSIKSGNSSGLFSLDSASGIISLASGKFLDYETNSSYNLVINATDGSSTDSSRVAVNVMDVAESFAPTTNSIHVDTTGQPDHITGTISAAGQTSWAAVPLDADRDVQFGFSGSGSLDRSNITIKAIYNDFGHQVTAPNSNFVTFAAPYASTFYLLLEGSAAGSYNLGVSGDGTPHTGTP